jgi:hypothetical protein
MSPRVFLAACGVLLLGTSSALSETSEWVYHIRVRATENRRALSHISFTVDPGATVVQRPSEEASIIRTYASGGDSRMDYVVVYDSPQSVKYEDATVALGDDGAGASDSFVIRVTCESAPSITVETKAGTGSTETVVQPQLEDEDVVDSNGFELELLKIYEDPGPGYD